MWLFRRKRRCWRCLDRLIAGIIIGGAIGSIIGKKLLERKHEEHEHTEGEEKHE